ncbi:pyruvate kinase [Haematococcus lacustris]
MVHLGLEAVLAGTPATICKTKVVCTLGPKSNTVPVLEELLKAGMSVARFNFSHGSHDYHQDTLNALRQAMQNTRIMCATMLDTKGPEIRTGMLEGGKPVQLVTGQEVTITTDYTTQGNASLIAMSYKKLAVDVRPGSQILCADGSIVMEVVSTNPDAGTVQARCLNTAVLGERKNVNLPGVVVDLPTLTEKDVDDIINWAVPNDIDFIAASFVRKGSDIDKIRQVLGEKGRYIKIISKVENQEGIQNFDEILAKTDSVMVARGDLGMEIPTEKIFLAQKMMIQKCNYAGKPVITATQMLESMIKNPRPTRAEATDVANAVLDGTDCVMLSGETAAGSFPVDAVKVMTKICREAEASLDYYAMFKNILKQTPTPMSPLESLASSAVRTAHKVHASLIVVLTRGGSTARLVAKYRPLVPVLTVAVPVLTTDSLTWSCSGESPARQCLVTRGLLPLLAEGSARATDTDTTDEILAAAIEHAKRMRYCMKGDAIVALHRIGNASVIKIVDIK